MNEKLMLLGLTTLISVLGYFLHKTLAQIEEKQKDHSKTLYNTAERTVRIEAKQNANETTLLHLSNKIDSIALSTREAKSTLDHNLYEMRQSLKHLRDTQYEHEKNYGKIIVIVQKLYAAIRKAP